MILVCINRIFLDFVEGNIGFVCWSTLYVSNNWILFSTVCVILFGSEILVNWTIVGVVRFELLEYNYIKKNDQTEYFTNGTFNKDSL